MPWAGSSTLQIPRCGCTSPSQVIHCSVVLLQVGMPTEGEPLVMDMATSSTAYFALVEAQRAGRPVPDDVGFDADGRVTTDAAAILAGGAMRSFDRCGRSPWEMTAL